MVARHRRGARCALPAARELTRARGHRAQPSPLSLDCRQAAAVTFGQRLQRLLLWRRLGAGLMRAHCIASARHRTRRGTAAPRRAPRRHSPPARAHLSMGHSLATAAAAHFVAHRARRLRATSHVRELASAGRARGRGRQRPARRPPHARLQWRRLPSEPLLHVGGRHAAARHHRGSRMPPGLPRLQPRPDGGGARRLPPRLVDRHHLRRRLGLCRPRRGRSLFKPDLVRGGCTARAPRGEAGDGPTKALGWPSDLTRARVCIGRCRWATPSTDSPRLPPTASDSHRLPPTPSDSH